MFDLHIETVCTRYVPMYSTLPELWLVQTLTAFFRGLKMLPCYVKTHTDTLPSFSSKLLSHPSSGQSRARAAWHSILRVWLHYLSVLFVTVYADMWFGDVRRASISKESRSTKLLQHTVCNVHAYPKFWKVPSISADACCMLSEKNWWVGVHVCEQFWARTLRALDKFLRGKKGFC